jgi:hypothetical protein
MEQQQVKAAKIARREVVKARKKEERDSWDALTDIQKRQYRKNAIIEYCKIFLTEDQILPLKEFDNCMLRFRQRKMNLEAWKRRFQQEIKKEKMLQGNIK